ncbi:hypothetical protein AOLI_G00002480 [Acnodon oligacanthus]
MKGEINKVGKWSAPWQAAPRKHLWQEGSAQCPCPTCLSAPWHRNGHLLRHRCQTHRIHTNICLLYNKSEREGEMWEKSSCPSQTWGTRPARAAAVRECFARQKCTIHPQPNSVSVPHLPAPNCPLGTKHEQTGVTRSDQEQTDRENISNASPESSNLQQPNEFPAIFIENIYTLM